MGKRYLGTQYATWSLLSPVGLEEYLRLGNAISQRSLWGLKTHVDSVSNGWGSDRLVHLLLCLFSYLKANTCCLCSTHKAEGIQIDVNRKDGVVKQSLR